MNREVTYYSVDFDDGSFCENVSPVDVVNYDCLQLGAPPIGAKVVVRWFDGKNYAGKYRGQKRVLISKKKSRPGKSHKPLKAKTVAVKRSNPIPEQADTVDHALRLDQEEMEKEPILQSASINESHQKQPSMTFSPYFSW